MEIINYKDSGSFSNVYEINYIPLNKKCLMKLEEKNKDKLYYEMLIYKKLNSKDYNLFLPNIYDFIETDNYNCLIMEDCGISLETLINNSKYKNKVNINNVDYTFNILNNELFLFLKEQMVKCIEYIHKYDIIHRDIKPANFIYNEDTKTLKLVDFGLAYILNEKNKLKKSNKFIGTYRYCSKNALRKYNLFYKDDCESLLYTLLFCYYGFLPWQNSLSYNKVNKLKYSNDNYKKDFNLDDYFYYSLEYIDSLKFNEKPDYNLLI